MRALLVQLDGKIPNIALMRLSAHLKNAGVDVELRRCGNSRSLATIGITPWDSFDAVYASLIFERTRHLADQLLSVREDAVVGGTGWSLTRTLENTCAVETKEQDYSLYPNWQQSIGFTQRGCRLKCQFCVVPRKEGKVTEEQTIAELWRGEPHPRHLILLDNDFFGQPNWRERIAEIRDGGFKVSFNQGINARFLDEETAAAIASVDYRDDGMKDKRIYTAWDNIGDQGRLFRGLELLVKHGVKPRHIMVYMLVGYYSGETHADRDYRRAALRDFGALPYPMPFVRAPDLVAFQRWVIGGYDKSIPWDEWMAARGQPRNLRRRNAAGQLRLKLLDEDT